MRTEFVSELIGTFSMVFIGCLAIKNGHSAPIVSLAFGIAVCLVILISRKYSGAHINPAVSIAFAITGELERKLLPAYLTGQFLGALIAGLLIGEYGATEFSTNLSFGIFIEIFITFALMLSIYLTIWHTDNDLFVAVVVGVMVALLAFYFGEYTGASMNPARTLGPNVASSSFNSIPIYFAATILGSSIAAIFAKKIHYNSKN